MNHLSASIKGFYPFPGDPLQQGILGWIFRDVHQAVVVRYGGEGGGDGNERMLVDFMTAGGVTHPVWWDERLKWHVLLGGEIEGEVRIRQYAQSSSADSKMSRLRRRLEEYDTRMSLYSGNCRVFACRVVREVERLNAEDDEDRGSARAWAAARAADARLAFGLLRAGLLPAAYPLAVLALCWEGVKGL